MSTSQKKQILLTNDDGIQSPGLWAAASALETLGFVTVAAPREQYSGAGRSLPSNSDGIIETRQVEVNGKAWTVYAIGGSPAQTVLHGALEIMPTLPDLVVSGINFGENVGTGITVSGTVGAALEGAGIGIPALAVSLETEIEHHYHFSDDLDFTAAAHFTSIFAEIMLKEKMPPDVDVINVNIPANATNDTPWEMTRISRVRLFEAIVPKRASWTEPGRIGYQFSTKRDQALPETDVHAIRTNNSVSVTPISLDMTSRIDLDEFQKSLRGLA
jgi:5'-nucleotidase